MKHFLVLWSFIEFSIIPLQSKINFGFSVTTKQISSPDHERKQFPTPSKYIHAESIIYEYNIPSIYTYIVNTE